MPLYQFEDRIPKVDPLAFIAPTATLVGDVTVEAGASVWYNAVLRGDLGRIVVRAGANVQDGSVLHASERHPCEVGPRATVAHLCLVHGSIIEEEALVANGCTVLDGVVVGARSLVAAHSLVPAGMQIPPGMLVAGSPAEIKRPLAGTPGEQIPLRIGRGYIKLARRHARGINELPLPPT